MALILTSYAQQSSEDSEEEGSERRAQATTSHNLLTRHLTEEVRGREGEGGKGGKRSKREEMGEKEGRKEGEERQKGWEEEEKKGVKKRRGRGAGTQEAYIFYSVIPLENDTSYCELCNERQGHNCRVCMCQFLLLYFCCSFAGGITGSPVLHR